MPKQIAQIAGAAASLIAVTTEQGMKAVPPTQTPLVPFVIELGVTDKISDTVVPGEWTYAFFLR